MAINAEEVNDWFRCYYFKSTFDPEAGSFDHLHRWLIMSDHHLDRVHYFRPWLIKSLTRWLVNECLSIILDELGMFECVLSTEFRSYQIDGNIDRYFGALVNSLHNHLDSGWWTRIPRRISPPPPTPVRRQGKLMEVWLPKIIHEKRKEKQDSLLDEGERWRQRGEEFRPQRKLQWSTQPPVPARQDLPEWSKSKRKPNPVCTSKKKHK